MIAVIGFEVYLGLPLLAGAARVIGFKVPNARAETIRQVDLPKPIYTSAPIYTRADVSTPTVFPTPTIQPTYTPLPTYTPYPSPTVVPATSTPSVTSIPNWFAGAYKPPEPGRGLDPGGEWKDIKVKLSYYWPPFGYQGGKYEINCDKNPDGVLECEQMSSGYLVKDYVGFAASCPDEFEFGTVFLIAGQRWVCMDRGGAITRVDDQTVWIDLLYPVMPVPGAHWSTVIDAQYSTYKVLLP